MTMVRERSFYESSDITTGSTSASSTGNTITLTAGSVYAVKATLATGTFGGGAPNAWWALGQ